MERKTLYWILGLTIVGLLILAAISSNRRSSNSAEDGSAVAAGKWRMSESRSPMDDSLTVITSLDSEDNITGPVQSTRPTLIVRCKGKNTDVYLVTGVAASIERSMIGDLKSYHTVRLRLDQADATVTAWDDSTDRRTLFLRSLTLDPMSYHDSIPFAKQLARANTLIIEFTPFDSPPATIRFDLRGGEQHIKRVAEACGWSLD